MGSIRRDHVASARARYALFCARLSSALSRRCRQPWQVGSQPAGSDPIGIKVGPVAGASDQRLGSDHGVRKRAEHERHRDRQTGDELGQEAE